MTIQTAGRERGFDDFARHELSGPPIMWSEGRSAIHEMLWRGEITAEDAERTRVELERCPVKMRTPARLGDVAWQIAEELGWYKTYDAEYLALARLSNARVITLDGRLYRGARRSGLVITPADLAL